MNTENKSYTKKRDTSCKKRYQRIFMDLEKIPKMYPKSQLELLSKTLQISHSERINALRSLMILQNNVIGVTFLSRFNSLFYLNEAQMFKGEKNFGFYLKDLVVGFPLKSKSDIPFALTETKCVPIKSYLSLQFFDYSQPLGILSQSNMFNSWKTNKEKTILCVGNINFINEIITSFVLNEILSGHPCYTYQYDAFFCGDCGYTIKEIPNVGTLQTHLENNRGQITDVFLVEMMRQILGCLSILKRNEYGFNHNNLRVKNILVNNTLKKESRIEYKIDGFQKSSIFWNGIRFYNNSLDFVVKNFPFSLKEGKWYSFEDWNNDTVPLDIYLEHNPFGFFSSYDVYSLLYSLMLEPAVWDFVYPKFFRKETSVFLDMWKSLFLEKDFIEIMSEISLSHIKLNSFPSTYTETLSTMRNKKITDKQFYKNRLFLHNIDAIYEKVGVLPPSSNIQNSFPFTEGRKLTLTNANKLCIEPNTIQRGVNGSWCKTNLYSKAFVVYDWDYCCNI